MNLISWGEYGSDLIANDDEVTGAWSIINVLEDTVVDTLTGSMTADHGSLPTLHRADCLFGFFTTVKLTSGSVIAYRCREPA